MENPFYQKPKKIEREPRVNIHAEIAVAAKYRRPPKAEEVPVQVSIADISERGALFITSRAGIPVEAEGRITFPLPGLEHELPVTVAWKAKRIVNLEGDRFGTGVEFTEISETGRRSLKSYVALRNLGETI